ncbi:MAG: ribulose-phosphate 3-epimerase [Pirellulaceae bacterium]|nr:ribulose-phosphate 3-epimerase [Pirellulaceae bacterium]
MSRRDHLVRLRGQGPLVLPSLLQCDFGNLQAEVRRLEAAEVQALHLDVMDGCFVPNLTYGMPIVAAIRRLTDLPLDVHLMIADPGRYVEAFYEAGADLLTIHVEAADEPRAVLERIRDRGMAAGVALNPGTPLTTIEQLLDAVDLVLVMSVEAGFGGQAFNRVALEKLSWLRSRVAAGTVLEVDGGIDPTTIGSCAEAGATWFVVGSAIFRRQDYTATVADLVHRAALL